MLTEEQIKQKLKDDGWANFVYEGGSKRLLENWKKVVEYVEKGCGPNDLIEEYQNDLDTRKAIKLVELEDQVKDLDDRFIKATTRREIRFWDWGKDKDDSDFWCFGYPKNAKGYFLTEFEYYFPENKYKNFYNYLNKLEKVPMSSPDDDFMDNMRTELELDQDLMVGSMSYIEQEKSMPDWQVKKVKELPERLNKFQEDLKKHTPTRESINYFISLEKYLWGLKVMAMYLNNLVK